LLSNSVSVDIRVSKTISLKLIKIDFWIVAKQ